MGRFYSSSCAGNFDTDLMEGVPELDGGGDGGIIFQASQTPIPLGTGMKYPVRILPHFDED